MARPFLNFSTAYRTGHPVLSRLGFPAYPALDWQAAYARRAAHNTPREQLAATLAAQLEALQAPEPAQQNAEALRSSTTFCVTTGQQPVLYGGPLYILYKAITAIKLAQQAEAQLPPGTRVVPVFWTASEDHDAAEVNHTWMGWDTPLKYPLPNAVAVGRHVLTADLPQYASLPAQVQAAYQPGKTWSFAFRKWLSDLLGPYGLVVIEPDDPALKSVFTPVVQEELAHVASFRAFEATSAELRANGLDDQAAARDINLFYLTDTERLTLEPTANGQVAARGAIKQAVSAWQAEAALYPERFSPNVVLRPIYQEMLLPNLAYVGGWGELRYWAQLPGVFRRWQLPFPLVVPRASALLVRHAAAEALAASRFSWANWLRPPQELRSDVLALQEQQQATELNRLKAKLAEAFAQVDVWVRAADTGQAKRLQGYRHQTNDFLDNLATKRAKALAAQQASDWRSAWEARLATEPAGRVQERTLNPASFARHHQAELVSWLLQELDPLEGYRQVLVLPRNLAS